MTRTTCPYCPARLKEKFLRGHVSQSHPTEYSASWASDDDEPVQTDSDRNPEPAPPRTLAAAQPRRTRT